MNDAPVSPHNLDAERSVLGAILVHNAAFPPAAARLASSDFYRDAHRRIFAHMATLHGRDEPIDFVTLREELVRGGELEEVGGPAYLASLADGVPRSANVEHYASIVRQAANARTVCAFARQAIEEFTADPGALGNGAGARYAEAVRLAVEHAHGTPKPALRALTMTELATFQFEHRRALLYRAGQAVLREGHILQVHGERGVGKSLFVTTAAIVAGTGTDAVGFSAPEPCRVLYIDGEMASEEIQSREAELRERLNVLATDNLVILAADWQDAMLPRLDTPEGQAAVRPFVDAAQIIIIDNRSTLFDPDAEKDPSAWQPAQDWLLSLRRQGKAVIVVHHSNRAGGARGHSKPEDVMNTIIKLSKPEDYRADQGARFTVEFTKSRGAHGAAVMPFTTQLTAAGWAIEDDNQDGRNSTVRKLLDYLTLSHAAGDRPKSANAAITGAKVGRNPGLKAWSEMLTRGEIVKHPDGGWAPHE